MPHVKLHTPMSPQLSAGMVCFDVVGHTAEQVEAHFLTHGVVASTTPYCVSHARLAPSLINDEDEVEQAVAAVAALR